MHIVKFASSKLLIYPLHTAKNNRALTITENIKFLGMHLDHNLTWKSHIDNLFKKLNSICLMLRKLLHTVFLKMLPMVYFAHFYSQISYGIIFWGSSSSVRNVSIIRNKAIRIMLRLGPRNHCREGFKKLDVLTVPYLCIYALMLHAVKYLNIYQTNSSVHGMNTRQQNELHIPLVRMSSIQRGVYCSPVKIFSQLPQKIFKFHNNIHTFKDYLVKNAFYFNKEFLSTGHNDVDI